MAGFTHLHTASGFSVRYGAAYPEQLVQRAAERGMAHLALTDRDTLAGTVRFAKACAGSGIRPVFGAELAVTGQAAAPGGRAPVRGGAFIDESAPRAVFLARDRAGWATLCRLIGAAHAAATLRGGARAVLDFDELRRYPPRGLIVLLGPVSEPVRALSAGRPDIAARLLAPWRELYGAGLRLEAVYHGATGTGPGSLRLAARTVGFAAGAQVPAVLSNAVRYADPDQAPVADVLDAARRLVPIDPGHLDSGQRWLKGPAEMNQLARQVAASAGQPPGGAARLLAETERTAAECQIAPRDDLGLGTVHFPEPELVGATPRSAPRVLRSRCAAAMVLRGLEKRPDVWRRLDDELTIINQLGYASYFLTVAQVVDDVKAMGIRVAARGSGAGSLVNHLLGIAAANPVEHGLLMERFLSPRRAALPDIDIDVESARRLEVYRRIFERFGEERVATVAMPETYRVRHAIRDVGAALSMDPDQIDRVAKSFPHIRARDATAALAELPELRELREAGFQTGAYRRFWDLVERLDALPRGVAMHPCGVILSDTSLHDRSPVVPSADGFAMVQFDKDDVEDLGLLKLDVLGVRIQSAMAYAVAEIERVTSDAVDLSTIPKDDPAAFELIRSTETLGCFQIESPGQRDLLGRLQPSTFHDLVVDISLFRPGPVAADMVRPFIEARHGRRPASYPHPDLRDALAETHGVVVFHEQVIRIFSILTGCEAALADEARRALSDRSRAGRVHDWFTAQATARGYPSDVVARTWEILAAFGSYGFCKAHAVAFAVPTLASAWLKAHHPAAFYAGVLTHDPGMYPKRLLLADARRRGVPILPLDVNHSGAGYRVEPVPGGGLGLRLALSDVYGISGAEVSRIVEGAPYASLQDLWRRASPDRPTAERLVEVGALDPLTGGLTRRDLLRQVAALHREGARHRSAPAQVPIDLPPSQPAPAARHLPELTEQEKLQAELSILGLDVSHHLMGDLHGLLDEVNATPARRLAKLPHGAQVLVAGAKAAIQTPPIRSGKRVIFTTLDDGTGLVDCAFFEDSHPACAHVAFHSWLLLVRGTVQRRGPRSLSVVGTRCWDLAALAAARRAGGPEAVQVLLARADRPEQAPQESRVVRLPGGFELHPWADLQPPGEGPASLRRLWHSSPGSPG